MVESRLNAFGKEGRKEFVEKIYISNLPILLIAGDRFRRWHRLEVTTEELVQEVSTQLCRKIKTFVGKPEDEVTSMLIKLLWFTGHNLLRLQIAKKHSGRCVRIDDLDPGEVVSLIDYDPFHEEVIALQDLLETVLQALHPDDSSLLRRWLQGIPASRIAKEERTGQSAIRKRLTRAIDRLSFHFRKHYPGARSL